MFTSWCYSLELPKSTEVHVPFILVYFLDVIDCRWVQVVVFTFICYVVFRLHWSRMLRHFTKYIFLSLCLFLSSCFHAAKTFGYSLPRYYLNDLKWVQEQQQEGVLNANWAFLLAKRWPLIHYSSSPWMGNSASTQCFQSLSIMVNKCNLHW